MSKIIFSGRFFVYYCVLLQSPPEGNGVDLRKHKSFARLYKGGGVQRARVSGGHLCAAEAPTEPAGETQSLWSRSAERETPFTLSLRKG